MNSTKPRVVAIIVARLNSSRLPRKQLRNIAGKPMMAHIIERLDKTIGVDEVILATGPENENRELGQYVSKFNIETFYDDDVDDVTGRIYRAGKKYGADIVVMISGDCPLIDSEFIQEGIKLLASGSGDHIYIDQDTYECLHEGVTIRTLEMWDTINNKSTAWFHREHPGSILNEILNEFHAVEMIPEPEYQRHDFRMSVDTQADLDFMNSIYSVLYHDGEPINLKDVVALIDQYPKLKGLNSHVHQKGIKEHSLTLLFVTHADETLGKGHLARIIALADELRESFAVKCRFLINEDSAAIQILDSKDYPYQTYNLQDPLDSTTKLRVNIKSIKPSGIIFDLKLQSLLLLNDLLENLQIHQVIIDAQSPINSEWVNVIIPAIRYNGKQNNSNNMHHGPDFLLLDRTLHQKKRSGSSEGDGIIICSGAGGMPENNILAALKTITTQEITFIAGPYVNINKFESRVNSIGFNAFKILFDPADIFEIYSRAKLALSIFGVTTYELIALGIPTIVTSVLHKSDEELVNYLHKSGACFNGIASNGTILENAIADLLADEQRRTKLSQNGMQIIDGIGVQRTARLIIENIRLSDHFDDNTSIKESSHA